jgi:hypothetical protein
MIATACIMLLAVVEYYGLWCLIKETIEMKRQAYALDRSKVHHAPVEQAEELQEKRSS